jgi:hypothetical protein
MVKSPPGIFDITKVQWKNGLTTEVKGTDVGNTGNGTHEEPNGAYMLERMRATTVIVSRKKRGL